jgi:surfactin synthase thioesterase subunit
MGALVALLLTRKIGVGSLPLPVHLFLTGTGGPSANTHDKTLHALARDEFVREIMDLDGCPDEVFRDRELLDYVEPILRADLEAAERYEYEVWGNLNVPITVITGSEERIPVEELNAWQNETSHKVDFRTMRGKHFFIFDNAADIVNVIAKKLFQYSKTFYL